MNLGDTAARLGVPVEDIDRVHRLADGLPSAPLPAKARAPTLLDRLAVRPDELEPYAEPEGPDADVEVLRFVFRTLTTPLDQLPRRTVLQCAVADHLKAGRHWHWRRGSLPV